MNDPRIGKTLAKRPAIGGDILSLWNGDRGNDLLGPQAVDEASKQRIRNRRADRLFAMQLAQKG